MLKEWSSLNQREARRDLVSFWSLKVPAIAASASTALLQQMQLGMVSVLLGTLATVCILIDAMRPRGVLYNAHLAAAHELSSLALESATEISKIELSAEADKVPKALRLLEKIQEQRRGIATRIKVAEAAVRATSSLPAVAVGTSPRSAAGAQPSQ